MTDFLAVKKFGALRPVDPHGEEVLRSIREGETIRIAVARPRNARFHRLFFGLLGVVAEQTDYTTDQLLTLVKIGIGHVDTLVMADGEVAYHPRSISWAKMDEIEFRQFFDRAVDFIIQRILPGAEAADLEREVFERLGIDIGRAA